MVGGLIGGGGGEVKSRASWRYRAGRRVIIGRRKEGAEGCGKLYGPNTTPHNHNHHDHDHPTHTLFNT